MHAPLELQAERRSPRLSISLFWRTFFLLSLLLVVSTLGWYRLFHSLEYEPRVIDNARQIASLVNLSRAALTHSDAIARVSLAKTLAEQEKVRILPREPGDQFLPLNQSRLENHISHELVTRLGQDTVVARQVNDEPGLWIGFVIDGDPYWLLMERSRVNPSLESSTWVLGLSIVGALSLLGAALLARLINRPLKELSVAAARVRQGNYALARLDESGRASEVRAVNMGFNRMADQLSRIERDRATMLAGISHDLRTPLARLRLEVEMSVPDPEARAYMVADISQVDAIINKFLDYARPDQVHLNPLPLASVVQASMQPFLAHEDMHVETSIAPHLHVLGDEVELSRVLSNLFENARRYGRSPDQITRVRVAATLQGDWVILRVRDQGQGVPPAQLLILTQPFFRGDSARTSATGAGLGLSIVSKMVENMGGSLHLSNSASGGLEVVVRLRAGPAHPLPPDNDLSEAMTLPPDPETEAI